jgi:hypothetical protein
MSRRGCGMIATLRADMGVAAARGPSALDRCSLAESFFGGRVLR